MQVGLLPILLEEGESRLHANQAANCKECWKCTIELKYYVIEKCYMLLFFLLSFLPLNMRKTSNTK